MSYEGEIVVIGAGPAGLTAAYELSRHGIGGTIIELDGVVGGIARTVEREGCRFDIGGHRFFTKSKEIEHLWDEILGEPMLIRPRMSRIYYAGKFYDYPLNVTNALTNMGVLTTMSCLLSYIRARIFPIKNPANYEQWVVNHFGAKLFQMFFKSYTEKVWGISCTELGVDWAVQRIRGLSLGKAVSNAIWRQKDSEAIKSLIHSFRYPRLGPGQLWEQCARSVQEHGWKIRLNTRVMGVNVSNGRATTLVISNENSEIEELQTRHVLSSMPLRDLFRGFSPQPPKNVAAAASSLSYRDFLVVVLLVDVKNLFPDNWIYVHEPEVKVGRIQNFKNWSSELVADDRITSLGMEYFVNEGDQLWEMDDGSLVDLAYHELRVIGLASGPLLRGYVVRMPKAYPVYDTGYLDRLRIIREWLATIENIDCIGRNGQHRYNNQDHSMATALIAARNIALELERDPWAVNDAAEYHEIRTSESLVPISSKPVN